MDMIVIAIVKYPWVICVNMAITKFEVCPYVLNWQFGSSNGLGSSKRLATDLTGKTLGINLLRITAHYIPLLCSETTWPHKR